MSERDSGIAVMLEQIERTPDAFSRGSLVGACCRARMKMDDLSAEIEALRAAVLWLTGCLKGTGYQVVTDMDAIGTTDGPAVWNAHHAAVIARALEAPDA
jgi:hypothetical protein